MNKGVTPLLFSDLMLWAFYACEVTFSGKWCSFHCFSITAASSKAEKVLRCLCFSPPHRKVTLYVTWGWCVWCSGAGEPLHLLCENVAGNRCFCLCTLGCLWPLTGVVLSFGKSSGSCSFLCILHACMCISCMPDAWGDQKRAVDPLLAL